MLQKIQSQLNGVDKSVSVLSYIVLGVVLTLIARVVILLADGEVDAVWPVAANLAPLLALLGAIKIADRVLVANHLFRLNDRRLEQVRVNHYLTVILRDLRDTLGYTKKQLVEGGPMIVLESIADAVERRYESLFTKDVYDHLPGKAIDLISGMSGTIFGMRTLIAAGVAALPVKDRALVNVPAMSDNAAPIVGLSKAIDDVKQILEMIYELRAKMNET